MKTTERISQLKVLKSAAGYYIGRTYFDEDMGVELPYSRESGYYRSRKEAKIDLNYELKGEE